MGLDDTLDAAGNAAEHALGRGVRAALRGIGSGLGAAGWDSAGEAVSRAGDTAADHLGATVPEASLDESDHPTDLVHGDIGAIAETARHLRTFAGTFGSTASGLRATDTEHWRGRAAEAFRARFHPHPKQWSEAQQACESAAHAWETYATTVQWAQQQAREAAALHAAGERASHQVRHDPAEPVEQAAAQAAPPDPGLADRQQAQALLDRARQQRDVAAREAASAIARATAAAPPEPSFAESLAHEVTDSAVANGVENAHFAGGVVTGAAEIVKFARSLNPADTYNATHPAEYAAGVSATAAGLVHTAAHPAELAQGLVGTGWSTDPSESFGKLVPNLALTAATDGGGAAASTAERGAVGSAEQAAGRGAVAPDWGDLAQPTARVSEPAIHADSVPPQVAEQYIDHHYPWMHDINAARFHHDVPGYTQNCSNSVVTVDRRLDGTEVSSAPRRDPGWPDPRALGNPNASWHPAGSYDDVIRDLRDRGEGARGLVYIARPNGTGHVFNAVHDANGAVFLDGQSGRLAHLDHNISDLKYMPYR